MNLKKLSLALIISIFFWWPKDVWAQVDWINNFSSEITINNDTSISIIETIDYETTIDRHGIYRYIPQRYTRNNISYRAAVSDFVVTNEAGTAIPFSESIENSNYRFKIGHADRTYTGQQTYIISYQVDDALKRFDNHDELYWDITGEGWKAPIKKTQAVVNSPLAPITKVDCFTGKYGSDNGFCQSDFDKNQANFSYDGVISYGDNMSVLLALEQNGAIAFPSQMELLIKTILDNLLMLSVLLPVIIMFWLWFKKGRDWMFLSPNVFNNDPHKPKKLTPLFYKHRIPMAYEPLKDLTPGELGTMLDENVDSQDVVAEIIDLARKKYLSIKQTKKKGLFSSKEDFTFTKLKAANSSLPPQQKYLHDEFFKNRDTVKLSKLKGKFHTHMEKAKTLIAKSVTDKKLFTSNPRSTRTTSIVLAVLLTAIAFGGAIMLSLLYYTGLPIALMAVTAPIVWVLAYHMVQKTAVGSNYMMQAKGLRQTIKRGKWREEVKEKHLFIEEVLPFAIALGVVDKLAKDMEKLNIKPPEYFKGDSTSFAKGYALGALTKSFTYQTSKSLSYNPSSRGWSGGSGFSSGGGFSGGGGGGGGGGGW